MEDDYRNLIINLVERISDIKVLKRIYLFVQAIIS